jgi:uncharacterized protein with HEPN domain
MKPDIYVGLLSGKSKLSGKHVNRALKQAPDLEIENARRVVDARNWVIHGYDKVDDVIIWGIVVNQLPKLKLEIQRYLQE